MEDHLVEVASSLIAILFLGYLKIKKILKAQEKKIEEKLEGLNTLIKINTERVKHQIAGLDPSTYFTLDLTFESGMIINYPLIYQHSIEIFPGLSLILLRSNNSETVVMMHCNPSILIRLPMHSHKSIERIEIVEGSIWDKKNKKRYAKGDVWEIPSNEIHSGDFDGCVAIVRYIPPLSLASKRPVSLEGIQEAYRTYLG